MVRRIGISRGCVGSWWSFSGEMFDSLVRKDHRRWGEVYLRGLMLNRANVSGSHHPPFPALRPQARARAGRPGSEPIYTAFDSDAARHEVTRFVVELR